MHILLDDTKQTEEDVDVEVVCGGGWAVGALDVRLQRHPWHMMCVPWEDEG
jgi:hypothetical protein